MYIQNYNGRATAGTKTTATTAAVNYYNLVVDDNNVELIMSWL